MTYKQIINECINLNIEKEAIELLIMERLNIKRYELVLRLNEEIDSNIYQDIEKLKRGLPVQYILGYTYFYKSKFNVNSNVLIPRFDTEVLIDEVLKIIEKYYNNKKISIVDIGTGSGCIAISIKKEKPIIDMYAIDISKDALEFYSEGSCPSQPNMYC